MVRNYMRFIFLSGLLIIICGDYNLVPGQNFHSMKQAEDTLVSMYTSMNQIQDDSVKDLLNASFHQALYQALTFQGSENFQFESLKSLVKISSPDKKFTIYQWNLPHKNGNQAYFGFIKIPDSKPPLVFPLSATNDTSEDEDSANMDISHWFGALYYKILENEAAPGKKFYTLLGWSGKNAMVTQKVIEILSFDEQGKPKFGLPVFPDFGNGKLSRIIFRYSSTAAMSLKYEEQSIASDKSWNKKKREFEYKTRKVWLIVADRLVPLDPQLEGQYQFYVPAGDVFDGFEFKNGSWHFIRDIDSRNKD